jgi:hypothetical protein
MTVAQSALFDAVAGLCFLGSAGDAQAQAALVQQAAEVKPA